MDRPETEPMPRHLLLALSLYAFAAVALAGTPAGNDDAAGKAAKPAAATTTGGDSDGQPATTPAPTPSRTSARASAKRWHSMLPGMIR